MNTLKNYMFSFVDNIRIVSLSYHFLPFDIIIYIHKFLNLCQVSEDLIAFIFKSDGSNIRINSSYEMTPKKEKSRESVGVDIVCSTQDKCKCNVPSPLLSNSSKYL